VYFQNFITVSAHPPAFLTVFFMQLQGKPKKRGKYMARWEYQITVHEFPPRCEEKEIIECDQAGSCFVHDACQGGYGWLENIFREKGEEGWELVQSGYHNRELLCIWKKSIEIKGKN
jgi:hypothetical protein